MRLTLVNIVIKQSCIILSSIYLFVLVDPARSYNDYDQLLFICSLQDVEKAYPTVRASHDGKEVLAPNSSLQRKILIGLMTPIQSL